MGYAVYIPPKGITIKPAKYYAHIYTDDELRRFFAAADKSQSVPSRIVPIHHLFADSCMKLKEKIHYFLMDDEYFFMIRLGQPMPLANVYKNFRRYLEKAVFIVR